jgi:sugar phosphate isomerase/epimerase
MTMLLTLTSGSMRHRLGKKSDGLTVLDLPAFTIKQLKLHGLNLSASTLAGWTLEDLDKLRDRADKAACPCLVLVEDTPLALGHDDIKKRNLANQRVMKLAVAANRLGCSSIGLRLDAPDTPEAFEEAADDIRALMPQVERLELNILLAPHEGLAHSSERLTALIKRIGGFRIGSLPSFAAASAAGGDPIEHLRKLAPYAGAIHASIDSFNKKGAHKGCDLAQCVTAIRSVGFLNTLAIDFTGTGDPVPHIEKARDILQKAIDSENS